MALPNCNFLRELGAARVRASSLNDPDHVLMRLAADPLLVHDLVNHDRSQQPELMERPRLPLFNVVQAVDTRLRQKVGCGYRELESLHPASLRPEVFLPSIEDCQGSVSVSPIPVACPATGGGFWFVTLAVVALAFLIVLSVLR